MSVFVIFCSISAVPPSPFFRALFFDEAGKGDWASASAESGASINVYSVPICKRATVTDGVASRGGVRLQFRIRIHHVPR